MVTLSKKVVVLVMLTLITFGLTGCGQHSNCVYQIRTKDGTYNLFHLFYASDTGLMVRNTVFHSEKEYENVTTIRLRDIDSMWHIHSKYTDGDRVLLLTVGIAGAIVVAAAGSIVSFGVDSKGSGISINKLPSKDFVVSLIIPSPYHYLSYLREVAKYQDPADFPERLRKRLGIP